MNDLLTYDLIVVGSGAAGLAGAVTFLEQSGDDRRVLVLERGTEAAQPGNSRWTGGFLMMPSAESVASDFVETLMLFERGGIDREPARHIESGRRYYETLAREAVPTITWLAQLGVEFQTNRDSYIVPNFLATRPVGEGAAVVAALLRRLEALGGTVQYQTTAVDLILDDAGAVCGVEILVHNGQRSLLRAGAVLLASGGFQGNPQMMTTHIGKSAWRLNTIAPGGTFNKGEGINMALRAGAAASGQWDMIHGEPTDPRSSRPDAVNTLYPFGILVDNTGHRFVDEGSDIFQETFESVSYRIFQLPGQIAWLIADSRIRDHQDIIRYSRGFFEYDRPYEAASVKQAASIIGVEVDVLKRVLEEFNAACGDESEFDPTILDGLSATGIEIPKSNWSLPIEKPPFLIWPVTCATCFTFGGIATDIEGRVLTNDARVIPRLFAAGEMTGVFYNRYAGGASFLRSLVFGRIAGKGISLKAYE